jgi:O-antigen ligase
MGRLRSLLQENRLTVVLGVLVFVAAIFRFSFDQGTQTAVHIALLLVLAAFFSKYHLSFRLSYHGLFLLFFLCALISAFGAADRAAARNELLVLADCAGAAFLFAFVPYRSKRKVLLVAVLLGLWFSMTQLAASVISPLLALKGKALPYEVIVNPNIIAGYLVLCLPLSFLFWRKDARHGQWLSALIFVGIIFTRSRAAGAVGLIALLAYLWQRRHAFDRRTVIVLLAGSGLLLCLGFIKADRMASLANRLSWYHAAFTMFLQSGANGIGWGNFGTLYLAFRPSAGLNTLYAHNIILQLLAETGAAGFLAFCLLLYAFIRNAMAIERPPYDGDFAPPVMIAALSFLAFNLFDYSFYIPGVMLLFFLCLGSVIFIEPHLRQKRILPSIAATVFVAAGAYIVLMPFAATMYYRYGLALMQQDRLNEAETEMRTALHLDPVSLLPRQALACLYFTRYDRGRKPSDLVAAIDEQSKYVQGLPENARAWSDLGWLYRTAGMKDRAVGSMGQAVRFDKYNAAYGRSLSQFEKEAAPR